jgi:hypothetical protein
MSLLGHGIETITFDGTQEYWVVQHRTPGVEDWKEAMPKRSEEDALAEMEQHRNYYKPGEIRVVHQEVRTVVTKQITVLYVHE